MPKNSSKNTILANSSESEEDNQPVVKSLKKKRRRVNDSEKETTDEECSTRKQCETPPDKNTCSAPRTSERLRKKSQRQYSRPDRKDVLDKITVRNSKYEDWKLKPRRLTNDFLRGLNRYVMDKNEVFESDDSELSDFIDDSEVVTGRKYSTTKVKRKEKVTRKTKLKKTIKLISPDEGVQKKDKGAVTSSEDSDVNCTKPKKMNKISYLSDEENSPSSEDEDGGNIQFRKGKRCLTNKIESSDSDEALDHLDVGRNLPKRMKSAKKEKEEQLLAELMAKRKIERSKLEQKNGGENTCTDSNIIEIDEIVSASDVSEDIFNASSSDNEITEATQHADTDAAEDLVAVLVEGESDREFVVDDEDCDDLDNWTEFLKHVRNADNSSLLNDKLNMKVKKAHSFQRIYVPVDSDESDDEASTSEIITAIKENNIECVSFTLKTNPGIVNVLGQKQRSLLHHAVISGSFEITKLLLHCNADKFATDSYHLQPISYAILTGYVNCLKLLLQDTDLMKVNKLCQDHFQFNLLHLVMHAKTSLPDLKCEVVEDTGLLQCLHVLCEYDKDSFMHMISEKDSQGFTPLVLAVAAGYSQCVDFLLCNGAIVDDFDSETGENLLHVAVKCSFELEELDRSCCLKTLLGTSLKDEVNAVDYSGFSPLMYAAQCGNHESVLALLEAGASVSCKDQHGTSSLHLAAASGDTQCVKLLLQHGHQVDCLDKFGWPPLLYANFAAQESCVLSLMEPNPKQIFVLGDLLKRSACDSAKERNFQVVKDVLIALANQDAYYRLFNDFIRRNPEFLEEYDQGLLHHTWRGLLDYDNKMSWFRQRLANYRKPRNIRPIDVLEVDREAVFESAMQRLKGYSSSKLINSSLRVTFKNEEGICTGPKREFFVNICKDIVNSHHGLFHLTDDNQYSFVPNAYFAEMAKIEGEKIEVENVTSNLKSNEDLNGLQGVMLDVSGSSSVVTGGGNSNGHLCTTMDTVQSSTQVPNRSVEYMDEIGDRIIAELDTGTTVDHDGQSCTNMDTTSNPTQVPNTTGDTNLAFAKHVEEKLVKNIAQLTFLGKIIGLAICERFFINLHLCKAIVKQILGIELSHPEDLSSFDYQMHKNLVTFVLESDQVEDMELSCDLNVVNPWNDRLTTLKLFSEERNEDIMTDKNKVEYVELVSKYKLTILIKEEVDALTRGLYEVIPKSLFSLFTADEFSLLTNGVEKIEVDDWRKNTLYSPCDAGSKYNEIKWFWEVVSQLKEEEKALLLKFSTGSPCLPAGGFSKLEGLGGATKFHIIIASDRRNKIPTASTCFNTLKLPMYDNMKNLKDKLLIAIRHGTEGFTFS